MKNHVELVYAVSQLEFIATNSGWNPFLITEVLFYETILNKGFFIATEWSV